ncbi:hypothetical protein BDV12DRAFT_211075 [Aspergillus spectabilis]
MSCYVTPPPSRLDMKPSACTVFHLRKYFDNALVEKHTFRSLNLNTARIADLQHIVTSCRRLNVREIDLKITLPQYSLAERIQFETDEDRRLNNQTFTQTICTLFEILSSWPDKFTLELSIRATSPRDFTEDAKPSSRRLRGMKRPGTDILHWRYMSSYLDMLKPAEAVPVAHAIFDLVVRRGVERNIAPAALSKLISRLPRLSNLTAALSDNERKDEHLRNRLRSEFAISLTQWPESLQQLIFEYPGEAPRDADYPPLKRSKPGADSFCPALRHLSQQLKHISLEGLMAGPELFWPQNKDDTNQPHWPNLISFNLTYAAATPSGEWLFNLNMDPPTDDAAQDEFPDDYRTAPSPLLNTMYIAAGYAAQQMPRLQTMDLIGQVQPGLNGLLRYQILSCEMRHEFHYDRGQGRVSWVGTSLFPLESETRGNIVEDESMAPQLHSDIQ